MYMGQLVFSQVTDHRPMRTFRCCVQRYPGEWYAKRFHCLDQHLSMAFAQLTCWESLRDIEACLHAHQRKLYNMGIVTYVKSNIQVQRRYSSLVDKSTGVKCDQTVIGMLAVSIT